MVVLGPNGKIPDGNYAPTGTCSTYTAPTYTCITTLSKGTQTTSATGGSTLIPLVMAGSYSTASIVSMFACLVALFALLK